MASETTSFDGPAMREAKRACPECGLIFEAAQGETGLLTCPLCDTVFSVRPPSAVASSSAPSAAAPDGASIPAARRGWKVSLAVAALLFLVGGLVYAYQQLDGLEKKAARAAHLEAAPASHAPEPLLGPEPPPRPEPPPLPKRPSFVAETRPSAPLPERIDAAIDRGVAYLRKQRNGPNPYRNYLSLLGLTLLECGIPAQDPSVQQIAVWLRARGSVLTATYDLALAILFLDRLNDPDDRALINALGQRLAAGQLECGAWSYTCPEKQHSPPPAPTVPRLPQVISRPYPSPPVRSAAQGRVIYRGDNSNTQFALLGLWVAQRHGTQVRRSLLAAEQYFRSTQRTDGSWSYHPHTPQCRDSMTCAGLLSLAMRQGLINGQGRGIRPEQRVFVHDRAIRQGLHFLAKSLPKVTRTNDRITSVEASDPLYSLWSLQRLALIYDCKSIGEREWYPWVAEMLVEVQRSDGSWLSPFGSPVGTCFALLILKRSNLTADLQLAVPSESLSHPAPPGSIIQVPARK